MLCPRQPDQERKHGIWVQVTQMECFIISIFARILSATVKCLCNFTIEIRLINDIEKLSFAQCRQSLSVVMYSVCRQNRHPTYQNQCEQWFISLCSLSSCTSIMYIDVHVCVTFIRPYKLYLLFENKGNQAIEKCGLRQIAWNIIYWAFPMQFCSR